MDNKTKSLGHHDYFYDLDQLVVDKSTWKAIVKTVKDKPIGKIIIIGTSGEI